MLLHWPGPSATTPASRKPVRRAHPATAASSKLRVIRSRDWDDLVEGLGRGELQSFYLILDHQFPALQFNDSQIIGGKMQESIVQFAFQDPMFPFQFSEMRLNCHSKPPR
jgi:hypothetical protein